MPPSGPDKRWVYITGDETVVLQVAVVIQVKPSFRNRLKQFYMRYQPEKLNDPTFLDNVTSYYKGNMQLRFDQNCSSVKALDCCVVGRKQHLRSDDDQTINYPIDQPSIRSN